MDRFDFNHAPYDQLSVAERIVLQKSVDIVFFDDGEEVIQPQQAISHLYVVIKGLVAERAMDGEVLALYRSRDTFDARALMEGCTQSRFTVEEQALLYRLPRAAVLEVMESNPRFGAYFYAGVAEKLANLSERAHAHEFESLFTATVRDACRQDTLWLEGDLRIADAAAAMKAHKSKSALIRHEGRTGLLTESVFRDILIAGASADEPLHTWVTFSLIGVDMNDFLFNALLSMMQHQIQRVVVHENDIAVGTLEQIDVLAYFSHHSHLVAQRLEVAGTIDELAGIAAQMNDSIRILHGNGVRAPQLAQLTQVLNTALFEKAWRIMAPAALYERSCLIVMGSEGRGEQILKTDQDNGLILREGVDEALARDVAERFSDTLARFGYPPCKGNIMVSNAQWRKTEDNFTRMLDGWCRTPTPEAMMNLAIFLDARAVAGDGALLDAVKHRLRAGMHKDSAMLMTFARAVELFDHHSSGFFAQWLGRSDNRKMDLKKMGIFPIVHGARALALEAGIPENNTFERLQSLMRLNILDAALAKDASEALAYFMDLRLKAGLSALRDPTVEKPNQVDFSTLSTLERDLLKDALQVVKRFKHRVRQHFHLGGH